MTSADVRFRFRELLKLFLCKELINFDALCNIYGKDLMSLTVFKQDTAHGKKSWEELKNRLIEHVRKRSRDSKKILLYDFHRT